MQLMKNTKPARSRMYGVKPVCAWMVLICIPGRASLAQDCGGLRYTITDLGAPVGSPHGTALDINNGGDIVGLGTTDPFAWTDPQPFFYSDGVMTILPLLDGGVTGRALAINESRDVVGNSDFCVVRWQYDQGVWAAPERLFETDPCEELGYSINDVGQICGGADLNEGLSWQPFLWHDSWPPPLVAFIADGVSGRANDVNSLGQVIVDEGFGAAGHLWTPDEPNGKLGVLTALPTLGGTFNEVTSISNLGQVVGYARIPEGDIHAFLWIPSQPNGTSGALCDLGMLEGGLESDAGGIQDSDTLNSATVVGKSTFDGSGVTHATLWRFDGDCESVVACDMNDLVDGGAGWELRRPRGINAAGQIVGDGVFDGATHAFLLTPIEQPVPTVSEWGLIVMSLLVLTAGTLVYSQCRPARA